VSAKQGSGIRKSGKVFGQGQKNAKMVRAGHYPRVSTQVQQTLPKQNIAKRAYGAWKSKLLYRPLCGSWKLKRRPIGSSTEALDLIAPADCRMVALLLFSAEFKKETSETALDANLTFA
jgi:hypothetical protein